jgi:hypothetical protein
MKPPRQWNAPLGLVQVLAVGFLLTGSLAGWILCIMSRLSSLLASQTHFAESQPFLYDIVHTAIAVMMLPWSFGVAFIYLYFYQRRYDSKIQRETTRAA